MHLQIKNLNIAYGTDLILENINFSLNQDDFLTILGESGSGKSTLIKAIAGLIPIVSGEISINNVTLQNLPPQDRNIGYVPQNSTLFPHLSVFENIAFGLRIRHFSEDQIISQVEKLANLANIEHLLQKKPAQISGGEAQRVSLLRALATQPKLILLDEPLSSIDLNLRNKLALDIKVIQHQLSVPVIHVTHDQIEARLISTKIALIANKTLRQFGPTKKVFNKPNSWDLAQIIGLQNILSPEICKILQKDYKIDLKYENQSQGGFLRQNLLKITTKPATKDNIKGMLILRTAGIAERKGIIQVKINQFTVYWTGILEEQSVFQEYEMVYINEIKQAFNSF